MVDEKEGTLILPVAEDPHSVALLETAKKAAKSNATILISGETGVGKEILARYIHDHSHFQAGPFITVNCAALPDTMMEAILFGYERGAFTSAVNQYVGKFEQAHEGTLFLDEIAEIPLELQAKLLRALQEREVEKLGGKRPVKINVRIIAASNRDLRQQVMAGYFRNDLYYRLNVLPIHCSPLRERRQDILPLAELFIQKYSVMLERQIPVLSDGAKQKLLDYSWPGNVREMENVIHRTLVLTSTSMIEKNDIQFEELPIQIPEIDNLSLLRSKLKMNEAKIIIDMLKETEGCRGVAAKKLNMSPRTLRYKISKLKSIGLKVP